MTPTTQDVQEQVLTAVRKGQEVTVEAIKHVADTVASVTPKLPVPARLADSLAAVGPAQQAVVSRVFDFADTLLADQRKFTDTLLADQRKFAEEALRATAVLWPAPKAADEDASEDGEPGGDAA